MFKLAVRLLGLIFLYHGLRELLPAIGLIFASFPHAIGNGFRSRGSFVGFIAGVATLVWPLLVSYWLLRGAPLIQRLAYPDGLAARNEGNREPQPVS